MDAHDRHATTDTRAGWTVRAWCTATTISRAAYYALPAAIAPRSVTVGRRRIITESPTGWLSRVGAHDGATR